MTPEEKVRRGKDNIYEHFPYLTSFVMKWNTVWTTKIKYAATDGPNLYLNHDFFDTLNLEETLDVLLHEAGHVMFGHMWRFPFGQNITPSEHHEYNVAADAALNSRLLTAGVYGKSTGNKIAAMMILPGRGTFDSWPMEKDAEFYLDLVRKQKPPQPPPQPPQPQPGQGDPTPQDDSGTDNSDQSASGKGKSKAGDEAGKGQGSDGESGDESEAGNASPGSGTSENLEIPESAMGGSTRTDLPESFGDVLPHPIIGEATEDELDEAIEKWKQQVARGINIARQQGTLPGWLEEIAQSVYGQKSKQNWRALLRRWMNKVVSHGGQTYDRPHRRLGYLSSTFGIILPANRSRQASKGLVYTDVSGSMSVEQCNLALSEMEGVFMNFPRCEIDMVMADTRLIEKYKKTFHRSDFPLRVPETWLGRGGTNLTPGILEMAKDRSYRWMVVISDMEWDAAACPNPGIPIIWVWTPRAGVTELEERETPTFGVLAGPVLVEAKH